MDNLPDSRGLLLCTALCCSSAQQKWMSEVTSFALLTEFLRIFVFLKILVCFDKQSWRHPGWPGTPRKWEVIEKPLRIPLQLGQIDRSVFITMNVWLWQQEKSIGIFCARRNETHCEWCQTWTQRVQRARGLKNLLGTLSSANVFHWH